MSFYSDVLIESAWSASFVPFASETTLYAMKAFGGHDLLLAVVIAVVGGVAMQMVNWAIGAWLCKVRRPGGWHISDAAYAKAKQLFNKYAVFLLLFSWAMGGNVLVVIAGFLGARPKMVLPLVAVGYIAHYGLAIL